MNRYGTQNWEKLWEQLEQQGNIGLDHVINPTLYPEIVDFLSEKPKSIVVDFGCGTNVMGIQLLFGYEASIKALKQSASLGEARFNTLLYLGIEGSDELTTQSNKYLSDIGKPKNIATIQAHIDKSLEGFFDSESVDLCVSRNFLMHLPNDDFQAHIEYVSGILKHGGRYIFATLNPEYEEMKADRRLVDGEAYEFSHGGNGEYGMFYHYFKESKSFEQVLQKNFSIIKKTPCLPITEDYKETHERYYNPDVPMAFVYVLEVIK